MHRFLLLFFVSFEELVTAYLERFSLSDASRMGWSKSTRIKVMLVIDIMFFLLELSVGFAVHSLALMADAFHMVSSSAGGDGGCLVCFADERAW